MYPPRNRDERAEYCVNPTDKLAHALGRKVIQHVRRQYRQAEQRTEQDAGHPLIGPAMSARDPPARNDVPANDGTQPQERAEARKAMQSHEPWLGKRWQFIGTAPLMQQQPGNAGYRKHREAAQQADFLPAGKS